MADKGKAHEPQEDALHSGIYWQYIDYDDDARFIRFKHPPYGEYGHVLYILGIDQENYDAIINHLDKGGGNFVTIIYKFDTLRHDKDGGHKHSVGLFDRVAYSPVEKN